MFKKSLLAALILSTNCYAIDATITISPTYEIQLYDTDDTTTLTEIGKYIIFRATNNGSRWTQIGNSKTIVNRKKLNKLKSASATVDFKNSNIQKLLKTIKTPQQAYDYIVQNIKYDTEIVPLILAKNYHELRSASRTLETKKGVCYDYSLLFAALCRGNGIECKVVEGLYDEKGHAWNEINGNIIDTTLKLYNPSTEFYKIEHYF